MAKVNAISGATAEEFELLTEKAKELGLETAQTMTDIAGGMEAFARAGFDATEIILAMDGAVALAESQVMDLGTAVKITGAVLRGMQLPASEAERVANALAATASSAAVTVEELGESMKYLAPVAAALGMPLEEALTAVAKLGDAGLRGGRATRALATALESLADPTDEAAEALAKLSIDTFDAEGNFIGIIELTGKLEEAFEDLGYTAEQQMAAMGAIFAGAAGEMNILIGAGRTNLEAYQDSITDTTVAFDQQAAMLDTVSGQWQIMKGSIELLLVTIGTKALPVIQGFLTDTMIPWVNRMTDAAEGTSIFETAIKKIIAPFQWMIKNGQAVKNSLIVIGVGLAAVVFYTNPILAITAALAGLVAVLTGDDGLPSTVKEMRDFNAEMDEMIAGLDGASRRTIIGFIGDYYEGLTDVITEMKNLGDISRKVYGDIVGELFNLQSEVLQLAPEDMADAFVLGADIILAKFEEMYPELGELRIGFIDTSDAAITAGESMALAATTIDNARNASAEAARILAEYRAGLEATGDTTGDVVVALSKLEKEYNKLMLAFDEADEGSREQADALNALQGFYDGLTEQVKTLGDHAIDANDELLTMITTLEAQGAITAEMIAAAIKAIKDEEAARAKAEKERLKEIEDRKQAAEELRLAEHGLWEETQELIKANEESIEGGQRQADTLQRLQGIYDEVIANLDALGISTGEASEETQLMVAALEKAGVVTVAMTKAQKDLEEAQEKAKRATEEHTQAIKSQAKELLNLAVTAVKDVVAAYKKMKQEAEDHAQTMRDIQEEFADREIEDAEDKADALEDEALRYTRKMEDIERDYARDKADIRAEDFEDAQDYLDKMAKVEENYREDKADAETRHTRELEDIDTAYTETTEQTAEDRITARDKEAQRFLDNKTTIFDALKELKDKVLEYAQEKIIENWIDGIADSWAGVATESTGAIDILSGFTTTSAPSLITALGSIFKALLPLAIGFGAFNDQIAEANERLTNFFSKLGFGSERYGTGTYRVTGDPAGGGAPYYDPAIQSGEEPYPTYDPIMDYVPTAESGAQGEGNTEVAIEINFGGVTVRDEQDARTLAETISVEMYNLYLSRLRSEAGVRT